MADWISFWNSDHPIYVNARHRDVHYRGIADDVSGYVTPGSAMLDYGCGEALHADRVAAKAARLILCEAAPNVREHLTARFASAGNIEVKSPEQVAGLPEGSLDLIVMHSVAQYLGEAELDRLLGVFHRLIKPDGLVIIGDIVPPQLAAPAAAVALLRFGAAKGFFCAAVGGLIRIFLSDYFRLKKSHGLSHYTQEAMLQRLTQAGYGARRADRNIGHNQWRMTFLARHYSGA
jgi:SAM-dependent methyltransferase